jgi:hypothetical protein
MSEEVMITRSEEEESRERQEETNITGIFEDTTEEEDQEDDEGPVDKREIWDVTDVIEKDLETTEGEGVDLLGGHLELVKG